MNSCHDDKICFQLNKRFMCYMPIYIKINLDMSYFENDYATSLRNLFGNTILNGKAASCLIFKVVC